MKRLAYISLGFMLATACVSAFGILGLGGNTWREEVLLHDGSKIIVERSQIRGGSREIGQPPPIKEHTISFLLPNSNKTITWTSEYGADIGRANFDLLAVHVLNGTPYVVVTPNLCLSFNKWGRPNPPYLFFKYYGNAWQRIPLSEFPTVLKTINVAVDTLEAEDKLVRLGFVSAEKIKELNDGGMLPEYRAILREPLPQAYVNRMCEELVYYKGAWVGPADSIGKRMMDSKSK
jgi:hypothetical protein